MRKFNLIVVLLCFFGGVSFYSVAQDKIVSLSLIGDEILLELFHRANKNYSNIIALSVLANDKRYSNIKIIPQNIKHFVYSKNIEQILDLKPTLVIAAWYNSPDVIHMLQSLKITIHIIKEIKTEDDIFFNILEIGRLINLDFYAKQLVDELKQKMSNIVDNSKTHKKIKVINFDFTSYLMGDGTTFDLATRILGIENMATSVLKLKGFKKVNIETFMYLNPDYLIVPVYDEIQDVHNFYIAVKKFPTLKHMQCVKDKKIIFVPYRLFSSVSHYFIDFIMYLHTQLFTHE